MDEKSNLIDGLEIVDFQIDDINLPFLDLKNIEQITVEQHSISIDFNNIILRPLADLCNFANFYHLILFNLIIYIFKLNNKKTLKFAIERELFLDPIDCFETEPVESYYFIVTFRFNDQLFYRDLIADLQEQLRQAKLDPRQHSISIREDSVSSLNIIYFCQSFKQVGHSKNMEWMKFEIKNSGFEFVFPKSALSIELEDFRKIFFNQLETLFGHIVREPDLPLAAVSLISNQMIKKQLADNKTHESKEVWDKGLVQLFKDQAANLPNKVAIQDAGKSYTFEELDEQSDRLALALKQLDLGNQPTIAICLDRSYELIAVVLAVLKIGGIFLPLDPLHPKQRLNFIINDSQPKLIITHQNHLYKMREGSLAENVVTLEDLQYSNLTASNLGAFDSAVDIPIYILYTSGTTGVPKGVIGSQLGTLNRLHWMWKQYPFEANEVCCFKTSFSFVDSICEIFSPLLKGFPLVIIPNDLLIDIPQLIDRFEHYHITRFVLVPSLLQAVLDQPISLIHRFSRQIRLCVSSGEALTKSLLSEFFSKAPNTILLNLYGSTEVAADAIYKELSPEDSYNHFVPIGRPIDNMQAFILNEKNGCIPVGLIGELYVAGIGLAYGYLNKPELTREKFVSLSLEGQEPIRLYKTGDLARYLPSGDIEYVGRVDHQIKIRGHRVELDEIDENLRHHPIVKNAVTLCLTKPSIGKELVSFVVCKHEIALTSSSDQIKEVLRSYLLEYLPSYMIPSNFIILEALPISVNGKVDRQKLLQVGSLKLEEKEAEAPSSFVTETEKNVFSIWSEVLQLRKIDVKSNFFQMGGHSLLAAKIMARIQEFYQIGLSVKILFENPSIRKLAQAIDLLKDNDSGYYSLISEDRTVTQTPLSSTQRRLWITEQIVANTPVYNLPQAFQLLGEMDEVALIQALEQLLERHQNLRTIIELNKGGEPFQTVQAFSLPLVKYDLSTLDGKAQQNLIQLYIDQEIKRPFSLNNNPLIRFLLIKLNDKNNIIIINMHHIISDGWSLEIFNQELGVLYEINKSKKTATIPRLPIQYSDYILWSTKGLGLKNPIDPLQYWSFQLKDPPSPIHLPAYKLRPKQRTGKGAHITHLLPTSLASTLREFIKSRQTTLFNVFYAAFYILLFRYSGKNDILVGTFVANRPRKELERLIGFFTNLIPLRLKCDPSDNFLKFLEKTQKVLLEAYEHQDVSFEQLTELLRTHREIDHQSLLPFVIVFENIENLNLQLEGLVSTPIPLFIDCAKFDCTLLIRENNDSIELNFEYATDLFDEEFMQKFTLHLENILSHCVVRPETSLKDISFLSDKEIKTFLDEWNTGAEFFSADCLHHRFEKIVQQFPHNIAIACDGKTMTYKELNQAASRLARYLQTIYRQPTLFAICLDRSLELIVSILAILKTGSAYVPIDPEYPKNRIEFILEDTKSAALITKSDYIDRFSGFNEAVVLLDQMMDAIAQQPGDNLDQIIDSQSLAYIIYTSGSTGSPKGVGIHHANVLRLFEATQEWFHFTSKDVWTLFHSFAFDFSVWEIWGALLHGGKLVIVPYLVSRSPDIFARLLSQEQVTILNQTPSAFYSLSVFILKNNEHLNLQGLRTVIFGGEALDFASLQPWVNCYGFDRPELVNMYGITETTIHVTYCKLTRENFDLSQGSLIGRPIRDLKLYILDEFMSPCPIGAAGELFVGGAGVAAGYLHRPDLTNERFIANPFSRDRNEKIYKTGDLVTYLSNGQLIYLRRKDRQVKLRGFRIEIGEIESVLMQYPKVQQAVVTLSEFPDTEKQLTAYVVLKGQEEQAQEIAHIKAYLKQKLPAYMIPVFIISLEKFPLNINGKVNLSALPNPHAILSNHSTAAVPLTDLQKKLYVLWKEVLKRKHIGLFDNFFDLGGHSLLAIQLINKINVDLKLSFPLNSLFRYPTLAELAEYIEKAIQGDNEPSAFPALPMIQSSSEKEEELPLSDIQQAYLIGRSGALALGHVSAYSYTEYEYSTLDINRLEIAWNRLIKRHSALRVVFHRMDVQKILSDPPYYFFKINDLRGLSKEEAEITLQNFREQLSHRVLPAHEWPLFEIQVSLYDTKIRLHMGIDALILDAWSENIIFKEWAALYQNLEVTLEPLQCNFGDYITADRKIKELEIYSQHRDYWMKRIAHFPPAPELPIRKSTDAHSSHQKFTRLSYSLPKEKWHFIKGVIKEEKTAPGSFLVTLFGLLLSQWSRRSHFAINLTTFNRMPLHKDIEKITGDFTSLVLLEMDIAKLSTVPFISKIKQIHDQLWKDLEHKLFTGVEFIREINKFHKSSADRMITYPVVFTSMLGINQGEEQHSLTLGDLSFKEVYGITQTPQVWLDFKVYEREGSLILEWDYVKEMFYPQVVEEMFQSFIKTLNSLSEDINFWNFHYFNLLPDEQAVIREEANHTQVPIKGPLLLHDLFFLQSAQKSDHLAVIQENITLTYRKLAQLSLALALKLISLKDKPKQLIGILMKKGWEQVVATLGILKGGFAYLPIDPSLPIARIKQLLEIGEVNTVITQPELKDLIFSIDRLRKLSARNILFVDDQLEHETLSQGTFPTPCSPESLAYVIFTSGSTGQPKGVMISHQAAINTLYDINNRFKISDQDRVLALSNLNFDLSVYDIFGLLSAGGAIIIPLQETLKDPKEWLYLINRHKVTVWNSVPAFMKMLVEFVKTGQHFDDLADKTSLKLIMMSGDWIPLDLYEQITHLLVDLSHPDFKGIISLGGATEASVWSIIYPITQVDSTWKSIPYGKPMSNQKMYVLHKDFSECPTWVIGSIYIGGVGLALGYWKDSFRTEQAFVRHPLTQERLYKTGDVGRYLPDGNIELLGREDFQVKINGHRIELEEIEFHLQQYPEVDQAVVQVIKYQDQDQLIAFVSSQKSMREEAGSVSSQIEYKLNRFSTFASSSRLKIKLENIFSPDEEQLFFARKSYRMFQGHSLTAFQVFKWLRTLLDIKVGHLTQSAQALSLSNLGKILSYFQAIHTESSPLPKYRYPSAGNLYPVQMYVVIQESFGIPKGTYTYNSLSNELVLLTDMFSGFNAKKPVTLFFVGKKSIIEPIYGAYARAFYQLEAGYMLGLLNIACQKENIALDLDLQPSESLGHEAAKNAFELEPGDEVICTVGLGDKGPQNQRSLSLGSLGLNPYIFFKPGSVEDANLHWQKFDLVTGKLVLPTSSPDFEEIKALFQENLPLFEGASLGILFGIEGKTNFSPQIYLEIGLISQYLMENAPSFLIGLCPIGKVSLDRNRSQLGLVGILHSLLGGPVSRSQIQDQSISKTKETAVLSAQGLKNHIAKALPPYMVPNHVISIDSFPLTTNGKIDRKGLQDIFEEWFASQHVEKNIKPRSTIEEQLLILWSEILPTKVESVETNFFHAGGDSILAVKAIGMLNQLFPKKISIGDLFNHPTIAKLSSLLNARFSSPEVLFHISNKPHCKTLFLAPPISGLSFCYIQLKTYLDNINVVGFNNPLFGSSADKNFKSIEEMATKFIQAMKQVQPQGPYLLGGWSFGGLVVYEMAQQLVSRGDEVEAIIMFDTYNNEMFEKNRMSPQSIQEDLAEEGIMPDSEEGKYFQVEVENNWKLFMEYQPKYYNGRVCVIKAQDGASVNSLDDLYNGWNRLIPQTTEIYSVAGTHGKMFFREKLKGVAEKINFIVQSPTRFNSKEIEVELLNQQLKLAVECKDSFLINQFKKFQGISS